MTKILVGCAALMMFAGCATAPRTLKAQRVRVVEMEEALARGSNLDPSKTYICSEEQKTGTHAKGPVCRSQKDLEIERQAAQEAFSRLSRNGYQR